MRIHRFLLAASLLTVFSLFYVFQQSEIFRLAYEGQYKVSALKEYLETNSLLQYSVERTTSVTCIGEKISDYGDFQMPESYRLVRTVLPEGGPFESRPKISRPSLFSRLFGIKRQAEAKTISPSSGFPSRY